MIAATAITGGVGSMGFLDSGASSSGDKLMSGGMMGMTGGMDGLHFDDPMAQEAMRRRQEAAAKAKGKGALAPPTDLD
jgi:hypothetical protein